MVRKIWEFYEYLFYKYTTWSEWLNLGMNPYAYQGGWGFLSLLLSFNFLTFLFILQIIIGYGFEQFASLPKWVIISISLVFLKINHVLFLKDRKYKAIIKKYENEDRKSKIKGNILAWGCIIFTIIAFISSAELASILRPPATESKHIIYMNKNQQSAMSQQDEMLKLEGAPTYNGPYKADN